MNIENPQISVLMGVYYQRDSIDLLERSIFSILNQSFFDFELLICDDGSNIQSSSFLSELAKKDIRIRLVRHGNLFTLPEKLNACLVESRGKWVARMDDDDYSHPERFERQLKYLNSHPEVSVVGCNVNLCLEGQIIGQRILPEFPSLHDFYFVQPYIHPALIFRKDALVAVGGYSESPHCILCEDYDLLLRMYTAGYHGYNLQEILFDYTIPATAKGNRKMRHRWNEVVTRYYRFRELKVLPSAWPYVIKPLAVGVLPEPLLRIIKQWKNRANKENII